MIKVLGGLLAGLLFLLPSVAVAQCNLHTYANPGGGIVFGNCNLATAPVSTDTVVGWQAGNANGAQTRAFQLEQITAGGFLGAFSSTTIGTSSQNQLVLTPGNTTSNAARITSTANAGGPLTLVSGTGNTNFGVLGVEGVLARRYRVGFPSIVFSGTTQPDQLAIFTAGISGTSSITDPATIGIRLGTINDTVDVTTAKSITFLHTVYNNGAGMTGVRIGSLGEMEIATPTTFTRITDGLIGHAMAVASHVNVGGTNAPGLTMGQLFGANFTARLDAGGTGWNGVIGQEINTGLAVGSDAAQHVTLQLVPFSTHGVQGTVTDTALRIGAQQGATVGYRNGITVGDPWSQFPVDTNGYLFSSELGHDSNTAQVAGGIDLNQIDFGGTGATGNGFALRAAGISLRTGNTDGGSVRVGYGTLAGTSTGASLDANLSKLTAISVNAGGTGWTVNDTAVDTNGNVVRVTTVAAGVVTAAVIYTPGWSSSVPATAAFTRQRAGGSSASGAGLVLNLTWTPQTALALNPSGGAIAMGGNTAFAAHTITGSAIAFTGGTVNGVTVGQTTPTFASMTRVNSSASSAQLQLNGGAGTADGVTMDWLWGRMRWLGTINAADPLADGQQGANKIVFLDAADVTGLNASAFYVLSSISGSTGAANTASRNSIHSRMTITGQVGPAPTLGPTVTNIPFVAQLGTIYATATQGGLGGWAPGNNPGVGYFRGSVFGGNDNAWTASGASNYLYLFGREIDVSIQGTSNVFGRFGLLISSFTSTKQADGDDDAAIAIVAAVANGFNFKNGITFGTSAGTVEISGALMKVMARVYPTPNTPAFTDGIDISGGTFSGNAWKSPGFTVGGTGNLGFYSAAPVAKPTGVAVTAAGIHAALVTLNLIAP